MTPGGFDQSADPVSVLAELPGAELTSTLLALARDRAAQRTPAQVLGQYERDRFVGSTPADAVRVAEISYRALSTLAPRFERMKSATPDGGSRCKRVR